MNKVANVVYPYSPKNDDELELSVGDKIEVIGFEEEGWWKGKLKGRIGVFPSNFVQVVETGPSPSPSVISAHQNNNSINSTKLPTIFGNKASKISLSSNSLNSNNSNSNNSTNPIPSNNNNDNSTNNINNNNLTMNNTQDNAGLACNDDASNTSSERRQPKPVRPMGYGDIFAAAKTKPLPADPTYNLSGNATDRSNSNYVGVLQKQIPKKPPPPTPVSTSTSNSASGRITPTTTNSITTENTNGNFVGQAPALPPKPANQYSPHLQHSILHPPPVASTAQLQVREQAKVIYAYEPTNDDELAIEVGDVIDIIDKNIEDQGWWKGELRGRTGVFPDNFVKLIETPKASQPLNDSTTATTNGPSQNQDWQLKGSHHNIPAIPNFNANQNNDTNKIKSLFASTPKGFSKELESNLEKHNNQASFLSLKRNKLQNPALSSEFESSINEMSKLDELVGQLDTSATKLNHITVNRAKGPNRKPPSNVLNRRNQLDQQVKSKLNGTVLGSLPINSSSLSNNNPQNSLSSLPPGPPNSIGLGPSITTPLTSKTNDVTASTNNRKTSPVVDRVLDSPTTPKTSQRFNQMSAALDKSKTSSTTTTPPWMVELKKAHADRKRDTPQISTTAVGTFDDEPVVETSPIATLESTNKLQNHNQQQQNVQLPNLQPQLPHPAPVSGLTSAQYDNLIKMISKSVSGEIAELREELQRVKVDLQEMDEIKTAFEVMKTELKACQSATESQKKYIRDLVNNLADERKKIAAMQVEIDRNLK